MPAPSAPPGAASARVAVGWPVVQSRLGQTVMSLLVKNVSLFKFTRSTHPMNKTAVILCWFLAFLSAGVAYSSQPNVVVFLADDQGWGDLCAHGNANLVTPHIDSLARDGASLGKLFLQ